MEEMINKAAAVEEVRKMAYQFGTGTACDI